MPAPEQIARKQFIDRMLVESGWDPIVPYDPIRRLRDHQLVAVEEYPTANGPADYLLIYGGQPLAVVEAKKEKIGPQNVLEQAQRYARGLADSPFAFGEYRVPFAYSSNGRQIWFRDLRDPYSRSREVAKFHTPSALREMLASSPSVALEWLQQNPVSYPYLRKYQLDAISSIENALCDGRRKMLVAMATGTGKTFTAIGLIYRLMKAGFARRVLFLVDRRALAAQARLSFSTFEGEPGLKFDRVYEVYSQRFRKEDIEEDSFDPRLLPSSYLTNPNLTHAYVYVSTIQRMSINLLGAPQGAGWDLDQETDAGKLDIPIHAFDLIIADECHRGYTASELGRWRETLEHFDGIKIGLTATPAVHTKAYFEFIPFTYGYQRAVQDGYLVDYDAITITSEVAVKGAFLHEGEIVQLQDRGTGQIRFEDLEDERELPAAALEADWAAPNRDEKIVKEAAGYLREWETEHGHFPKTLVFADNDLPHVSHADRLVNLFRDEFGQGDDFVKKITGSPDVDRPLQRIREFRNRPNPAIVVTVDMLSTGVDIPALEVIVFLRPVKSRILFEQMMGRGTRRCNDINKTHFLVLDAGGVLAYFEHASEMTADPPDKPSRSAREVIEDIYNNRDRDYNIRALVKRMQRMAKNITAEGRRIFERWIPDGDISQFAARLPDLLEEDWAGTMAILRDAQFQHWLENYPRARSPFLIADTVEDVVTSGYMIRLSDGRIVRPDDYLEAFTRYVQENPEHVEAIRILLERPDEWRTEALYELRKKLAARPEHFTDENLRRAYQHELADIISMVKHAAKGEPLLAAEERVSRAMAKLRAEMQFTPEQEQWLELIADHLHENLAISREDFSLPFFERAGASWGRVNRDFGGQLDTILAEVNAHIAA